VPKRKHHKCKTLITRYQPSREPHGITSTQLLIVVWKMCASSEEICVGVSEAKSKKQVPQQLLFKHNHKFGVCVAR
jgi:hypothetical protein